MSVALQLTVVSEMLSYIQTIVAELRTRCKDLFK